MSEKFFNSDVVPNPIERAGARTPTKIEGSVTNGKKEKSV